MRNSPLLGEPGEWADIVDRSLEDYRSGRSLMDHLGADRLIDPPLTGMLLAIRRGLIEEVNAASMADYALVDMAVIAFANAMRVQSIVGNTSLIIESEMFGQPTLRRSGSPNMAAGRRTFVASLSKITWFGCASAAAAGEAIPPDGQRSDRQSQAAEADALG